MLSQLTLALVLVASWAGAKQIEVPRVVNNNPVSIRLGSSKEVREPDFEFRQVYRREIHQVNTEDVSHHFAPCTSKRAEVEFDIKDQILFNGVPERPLVISDFNDIRYSQFLLDMYYEGLEIYLIFKNGLVSYIKLESDDRVESTQIITIEGLFDVEQMEIGYFIKLGGDLLFINNKFAIKVTSKSAQVIEGYEEHKQFQSVAALEQGYFVVAESDKGLYLYKYQDNNIEKANSASLDQLEAVSTEIMDIKYWQPRQTLIYIDGDKGIRTLKITFTEKEVKFQGTEVISNTPGCDLIYLYGNTLYASCKRIFAYYLDNWPRVQESKLPYPNVNVREIYEVDDYVALVGRNSFNLLYLGKLVNYYDDYNVDKLILAKDLFISANQGGLDIGDIKLIKPYVTCSPTDRQFLGVTSLMFTTVAECNQAFFEKYNMSYSALGTVGPDDVCRYTVYRPVDIWEAGEIKTYPFIGAIVGIAVVCLIAVVYFFTRYQKIVRISQLIKEYSSVNNSESAKAHHLAEQMDGGVDTLAVKMQEKAESKGQSKEAQHKKQSEVDLGHTID